MGLPLAMVIRSQLALHIARGQLASCLSFRTRERIAFGASHGLEP